MHQCPRSSVAVKKISGKRLAFLAVVMQGWCVYRTQTPVRTDKADIIVLCICMVDAMQMTPWRFKLDASFVYKITPIGPVSFLSLLERMIVQKVILIALNNVVLVFAIK